MPHYEVARDIGAEPSVVWKILTDADRLADGTFSVIKIEGTIAEGQKIRLWSDVDPDRAFSIHVRDVRPNASMVWENGLPFGLFKGSRRFEVTPVEGGTRFHMREDYTGALAGMMFKMIPDLQPSFETFGDGVKAAAEGANG